MRHFGITIMAVFMLGSLFFSSCGNKKQKEQEINPEFTMERREAIEAQMRSVTDMLDDRTKTATELYEPLIRLADTLLFAVRNDALFETNIVYRSLARFLIHRLPEDERGISDDCVYKFMWIPFQWCVDCGDSSEVMYTTFFRASSESEDRFACLLLAQFDGDQKSAMLTVTNYIDTIIGDLKIQFEKDTDDYWILPDYEEFTDFSDANSGIVRVSLPADDIIEWLRKCSAMRVSYKAKDGELIELIYLNMGFESQLKECPKLSAGHFD